jgi:hypothetical protein
MEVRIQSVVVEFILNNTESLFSSKVNAHKRESTGTALPWLRQSLWGHYGNFKNISLSAPRYQYPIQAQVSASVLSLH